MTMQRRYLIALLLLFGLAVCPAVHAQPLAPPAPKSSDEVDAELKALLDSLDPQQKEELIRLAQLRQLEHERKLVAVELCQGLLYDPDDIDDAVKILKESSAQNTEQNADAICEAVAKVDVRVTKAWQLLRDKKYAEAGKRLSKLVDTQRSTYASAAVQYLYAESLVGQKNDYKAAEVYRQLFMSMPDRISFATSAVWQAAKTYERLHRFKYAMDMYGLLLTNYAVTLSKERYEYCVSRIEHYAEIFKDPLKVVVDRMGVSETRLSVASNIDDALKAQEDVLALLDDLIQTSQENSSSQSSPTRRKKGQKDEEDNQQKSSDGKNKGDKSKGNAAKALLVKGAVVRPTRSARTHTAKDDGDWAQLPPEKQQELMKTLRQNMSKRYRGIAEEYHRSLSKQGQENK